MFNCLLPHHLLTHLHLPTGRYLTFTNVATTNSFTSSPHCTFLPPHAPSTQTNSTPSPVDHNTQLRGRAHGTSFSFLFISEHVVSFRCAKRVFEMSASNGVVATTEGGQTNVTLPPPPPKQVSPSKSWVHFDEENGDGSKNAAAVINTENVQVNLERSLSGSVSVEGGSNVAVVDPKPLRNVELPVATVEPIRQGFSKWRVDWGNVGGGVIGFFRFFSKW